MEIARLRAELARVTTSAQSSSRNTGRLIRPCKPTHHHGHGVRNSRARSLGCCPIAAAPSQHRPIECQNRVSVDLTFDNHRWGRDGYGRNAFGNLLIRSSRIVVIRHRWPPAITPCSPALTRVEKFSIRMRSADSRPGHAPAKSSRYA